MSRMTKDMGFLILQASIRIRTSYCCWVNLNSCIPVGYKAKHWTRLEIITK